MISRTTVFGLGKILLGLLVAFALSFGFVLFLASKGSGAETCRQAPAVEGKECCRQAPAVKVGDCSDACRCGCNEGLRCTCPPKTSFAVSHTVGVPYLHPAVMQVGSYVNCGPSGR